MSSQHTTWPENPTAELNPGNGHPFAVIHLDHNSNIHLRTAADADALIVAAVEAKRLLAGEPDLPSLDGTPAYTCTDPDCPDAVHQEPAQAGTS